MPGATTVSTRSTPSTDRFTKSCDSSARPIDVVLFVMAVVAGRVVARRVGALEIASLASVLVLLALDIFDQQRVAAAIALAAAALHGARLALWAPSKTGGRPILWILHPSYAWIVAHLALRGLAGFELVAAPLATHALTIGAIGGLTLVALFTLAFYPVLSRPRLDGKPG